MIARAPVVGILNAGRYPSDIDQSISTYPAMLRRLLGADFDYHEFDAQSAELPDPTGAFDAYIITGSASGVYDPDLWISELRAWLPQVPPNKPIVGICFGHQIMAEAFGGTVEKSRNGPSIGLRSHEILRQEPWMDQLAAFVIPVAHFDQVVKPPPSARLLASSEDCLYAAFSYSDRSAISFQGHPEFDRSFSAFLVDRWEQNGKISAAKAAEVRASLHVADDRARIGSWIKQLIKHKGSGH